MLRKPNITRLETAMALFGILSILGLTGCASPERTTTNFCRQLELEMPGIAEQPATPAMITSTVDRYKRLQELAPLQVETDWNALTLLMEKASKIDAADPTSVQEVVDLSYASEKNAAAAAAWVLATCGVDISTGLFVVQAPATDVATTDIATTLP